MLPLPDLDDRTWERIVEDARKLIPALIPEWTDWNYHDPGITILEMLAWLTEMQQYQLNRITPESQQKFFKLLGIRPREATPAEVDVFFENVPKDYPLPEGTKMEAGDLLFETTEKLQLISASLDKVVIDTRRGTMDYSAVNNGAETNYHLFGADGRKGTRLLLGFDRQLATDQIISLFIRLYDNYPINPAVPPAKAEDLVPSVNLKWCYYGTNKEINMGAEWLPIDILRDETVSFYGSGRLLFKIDGDMLPATLSGLTGKEQPEEAEDDEGTGGSERGEGTEPAEDFSQIQPLTSHLSIGREYYWLSCTLSEGSYEMSPRARQLGLNSVPARQVDTLGTFLLFSGDNSPRQVLSVEHYLAMFGFVRIMVREEDGGWMFWPEVSNINDARRDEKGFAVNKDLNKGTVLVCFGDGNHGRKPPAGDNNIRVLLYHPAFKMSRLPGHSNGLPEQVFTLKGVPFIPDNFKIMVGEPPLADFIGKDYFEDDTAKKTPPEEMMWHDWELVKSLDASGPRDRHFCYDTEKNAILFGNNEQGRIPCMAKSYNIMITAAKITGGENGNIKKEAIRGFTGMKKALPEVRVVNRIFAAGGADKETFDEVKQRIIPEINKRARAVSVEDYEQIALATPGLRVARAQAIPLFAPGLIDYPRQKIPAVVTVVVAPYSETDKPVPGKGFLTTVRNHLEKHRLLATEILVVPPIYIEITVQAVVVVEHQVKNLELQITRMLNEHLNPLGGNNGKGGWEFGRAVYRDYLISIINRMKGVLYINDLWLHASGEGFARDGAGGIIIPPHGLVYPGAHDIRQMGLAEVM